MWAILAILCSYIGYVTRVIVLNVIFKGYLECMKMGCTSIRYACLPLAAVLKHLFQMLVKLVNDSPEDTMWTLTCFCSVANLPWVS
jgi:hypothetical protein